MISRLESMELNTVVKMANKNQFSKAILVDP